MTTSSIPLKRCSRCGQEFPATTEFFYYRKEGKLKLESRCKDCLNAVAKAKRKVKRDLVASFNWLPDGYKRCTTCGQVFPGTTEYFHKHKTGHNGLTAECKSCHYKRSRKWVELHTEECKIYHKKYYTEHRSRHNELIMLKYYENPTPFKLSRKRYLNSPRGKATSKLHNQKRIMKEHSLPTDFTTDDWLSCLDYWNGQCAYCGCQQGFWNPITAEHFIPISNPNCPGTVRRNIIPACSSCNSSKLNRDADQWAIKKFGKRKATNILKRIREYLDQFKA